MIDNRVSVGVPDELMMAGGLPAGSGRGLFEAATYTCNHCGGVVVKNPDRQRPRGYCRKCDHMICDGCEATRARTFGCRPMQQVIDEVLTAAELSTQTKGNET